MVKNVIMESAIALFPEPQKAQAALEDLKSRGFEREHLGFALTDVIKEEDIAQATGVSPEAGAPGGSGSVIKGMIYGGLAGVVLVLPIWLLLLGVLPAELKHFAQGGVFGMLFGAIGGVALGGMFGALAGSDHGDYVKLLRNMGVPAAQAEKFYGGLQNGHTLVIARDPSGARTDEALSVMRKNGAVKLDDAAGGGRLQSERTGQGGH